MFASERFRRRVNKAQKASRGAVDESTTAELSHGFDLCVSHLPSELRADILAYLLDRHERRKDRFPTLFDYASYLGDVIDLLNMDYDEDSDPLYREDWEYVRDAVADFANELDMDVVSYVMRLVVAKGYLNP